MKQDYKKKALKEVYVGGAVGIGLVVVGIVATIVSYNSAEPGGTYTIWWGPPILGVILALKALWNLATLKKQAKRLEDADKAAAARDGQSPDNQQQ